MKEIRTFGELKKSNYIERSIKMEMAENLSAKLLNKEIIFPKIHGYEDTVIPQLVNAILSGHNIVMLGEKGQAKSRIMRALVNLLDERIPIIKGTEIPESPFHPITAKGKKIINEQGDNTELTWLTRDERYGERLAPGARIGDIIGDLDPSRIVNGEPLSSEGAIHFGLLPRMNRGIFAVNEMPDLDYLVQVSLFNILEEADIQIRGIPIRFPLDVMVCFTANPDDYSRSGKIISQLKDRIGSEIRTHYPKTRQIGLEITKQELKLPIKTPEIIVPPYIEEIIEEITIQARSSHLVNQKSGVSARLSIANYEVAVSSARKRALNFGELKGYVRLTDLGNIFASCSGKLLDQATRIIFEEYFPPKKYAANFNDIAKQIYTMGKLEISDLMPTASYRALLKSIPALWDLLHEKGMDGEDHLFVTGVEFILEGLASTQKLSRRRLGEISTFKTVDAY